MFLLFSHCGEWSGRTPVRTRERAGEEGLRSKTVVERAGRAGQRRVGDMGMEVVELNYVVEVFI